MNLDPLFTALPVTPLPNRAGSTGEQPDARCGSGRVKRGRAGRGSG